ncbi:MULTISPECIES: hypothetical protein [unclassified Plantibacter]|uniref:hypothetical protein n=1 Tax=unclassified Plantibacter TaxID=2624265 RepID=UPI000A9B2EB3|nr:MULTISPECIES: hypothetical protein [unclassified Plantibacter]
MFVRFQSAVPNRQGRYPGVFAMANGLHASGRLSEKRLTYEDDVQVVAVPFRHPDDWPL